MNKQPHRLIWTHVSGCSSSIIIIVCSEKIQCKCVDIEAKAPHVPRRRMIRDQTRLNITFAMLPVNVTRPSMSINGCMLHIWVAAKRAFHSNSTEQEWLHKRRKNKRKIHSLKRIISYVLLYTWDLNLYCDMKLAKDLINQPNNSTRIVINI